MLRCSSLLAIALASLISIKVAHADAAKQALSLGVETGGFVPDRDYWRKDITLAIEDLLKRANFAPKTIVQPGGLVHKEVTFQQLAAANGADFLVATRVANNMQRPPSYVLTVSAYSTEGKVPFRQQEFVCRCSEFQMKQKVLAMVSEVMKEPETSSSAPIEKPIQVEKALETPSKTKPLWLTMGIVGSAGVVASAISGGIFGAMHGSAECEADFPDNRLCPFRTNATTGIYTSLGLGLASAALAVTGFTLYARESKKARPVAIEVSSTGLAAFVRGTF